MTVQLVDQDPPSRTSEPLYHRDIAAGQPAVQQLLDLSDEHCNQQIMQAMAGCGRVGFFNHRDVAQPISVA